MLRSIPVLVYMAIAPGLVLAQSENTPPTSNGLSILDRPLVCRLKTVQIGQFRDLDYAAAPANGLSVVTIAASPSDLRMGQAAIIEADRAGVARIEDKSRQVVLLESEVGSDVAIFSLFLSDRQGDQVPAAFSRHSLIGNIPVVVQSQGTCTHAQGRQDR